MTAQPIMPQNQGNEENSFEAITLHDIIEIFFTNWRWFVASVVLCLGVAYFYLASTPSIYKREAMLLIKDSRKGGDLEMIKTEAGYQIIYYVGNSIKWETWCKDGLKNQNSENMMQSYADARPIDVRYWAIMLSDIPEEESK